MRSIFAIISIFTIVSCNITRSDKEIVRANVELLLMESLDDPESYEFVDLTALDTVLYIDNIKGRLLEWERFAVRSEGDAARQKRYKKDFPSMHSEGKIKISLNSSKQARGMIAKIDSIKTSLGDNVKNVASYSFVLKFRSNNKMGAKILSEQFVQTDNNLNIINITNNSDDVVMYPNDFPGYSELIK